ncbi:5-formyltetrahydrofolate cyclo-ligase [Sphingomonas jinjuensis]|uniref:5-formyltetrahydrofolate cyclo-ligase n=1 Tax=Sphingomonas jinjuensis TaxID=535907 RepID=A0A840FPP0_9SPHN|nr:5-formyltetrahydrofolate cyclo-ligase [Sphingomonas jinjuensis]MBB4155245.1 5-formyltetrahydrofolate cyclo-ligase [Sphingomonas jinjuensis]
MTDKRALRARMRGLRDDGDRSGTLAVPSVFHERLAPGLVVASYIPIGSEADPAPFADAATVAGCIIALPHVVDRASPMRFLRQVGTSALQPGPFGLRQPAADAAELAPDIILTPLVAFDRRGNRLGQGAGHYDRAFAAHPAAWRIGIAWAIQEHDGLTPDPWDMPLHAIATDKEWITP